KAASGGSAEGFDLFDKWRQGAPDYNADMVKKKWEGFHPTNIGFGTLKFYADKACPGWDITKDGYMEGKTKLACNVGNVLLALEQEPEIMNGFGYDEMARVPMLLRPLFDDDPSNFKLRPVTDADVTRVQEWLQWFRFRRLGKDTTHDAINAHAHDHSFH